MKKAFISLLMAAVLTISSVGVYAEDETETSAATKAWSKNSDGYFLDGDGNVLEGATMKGIDVSKWQGSIDWESVAGTDVDYAIIRCGYGDDLESQDDAYFEANVQGCEENNIPYGVYIYSYATTVAHAESEAAHVLRMISGHTLNFPIYLDLEDSSLPLDDLEEIALAFLNVISDAGYECGIYANLNWWQNYISSTISDNLNWYKWVAQWNDTGTDYSGVYQMWQCTSSGTVDGISGSVDINFWYGEVRDRSYNIYSSSSSVTLSASSIRPGRVTIKKVRKYKKAKKRILVRVYKVSKATGYKIQYSTTKNFKKVKSKKTTTKTCILKKLKRKTKYYIRVKAYRDYNGKRYFSSKWSKKVKIKTY